VEDKNKPDQDYTVKETAGTLKLSERQIWRWISAGRIKTRKYSSKIIRVPGKEIARIQAMAGGE